MNRNKEGLCKVRDYIGLTLGIHSLIPYVPLARGCASEPFWRDLEAGRVVVLARTSGRHDSWTGC